MLKPLQSGKSSSILTRLSVGLLIFSLLFSPLIKVSAQEVPPPDQGSDQTSGDTTQIANDDTGSDTGNSDSETITPPEDQPKDDETKDPDNTKIDPTDESLTPPLEPPPQAPIIGGGGPGSLILTSDSKAGLSPDVDNISGALVYNYDIKVPPGRTDKTTPDVSLIYDSATASNDSVVGSGWSINIPYIDRINKQGTDSLYSNDYYSSSLSGELTKLNSTDYVAKVEKGDFLKYTKLTNGWLVTDKNGTKYTFGLNAQARQDNPSDSTKIFKWMLEEVRDTNDNYISYIYFKDAGQIYPSQIVYTGNGSTDGVLEVNFDRSSRTGATNFYNTGFAVQSNYRITEIRTEVNNVWARKYTLAYTTNDTSTGSLLDTITESGQDDSSNVTTLPAVNFDYQTTVSNNWTSNSSYKLPSALFFANSTGQDPGLRFADINGDGLPDIVCHSRDTSTNNTTHPCNKANPKIYLNNGNGWTDVSSTWALPVGGSGDSQGVAFISTLGGTDNGVRLLDINGDGLADILDAAVGNFYYAFLNTGSGWTSAPSYVVPSAVFFANSTGQDPGLRMADINGDGLPDIVCHSRDTSTNNTTHPCNKANPKIYLNNGNGWTDVSSTWALPVGGSGDSQGVAFLSTLGGTDTGVRLIDVNGDGLSDFLDAQTGNFYYAFLNTGSGWTSNSSYALPSAVFFTNSTGQDPGMRMGDINGDGLPDIVCHSRDTSTNNTTHPCNKANPKVYLNNGNGWTDASSTWALPVGGSGDTQGEAFISTLGGTDNGVRLLDIDGDGLADFLDGAVGNFYYAFVNSNSTQTNLLKKITYSQGGSTSIAYKATPLYRDGSNNLLNPSLPLVIDAVSQLTTDDGSGNTQSYTYEYVGGLYYFNTYLDRKFAGFSSVKVTDSAGNVKKTYFYQGNSTNTSLGEYNDHAAKIGMPYRLEEYDNSSNLYRLTVDKVDRYNIGTDHDFVKIIRRTELDYDGNGGHKDTSTEYSYDDANGNLLTQNEWGEVTGSNDGSFTDTGSDERTTTYTYALNGTTLVNVPYNETVTNQSAAKVRENKYYYDTQTYGSVTKGNQTKIEQWVTGSTYVNSQKTYDSTYGLLATLTDPRGKITTYTTYDSYNLYPITITDPLSQTKQYTYDYSLGKPKQITDQNGFVYQTTYDGLDRVIVEKIPDFSSPYSAVTKTAYTYTDTSGAVKVQRTDYLDSSTVADMYQYFDGLGRPIQERKEAENSGDFNVKDTVYNNIGLIQKQSLPYTSSGSSKTSPTGVTALYITNTYDPLQRSLTISDATGNTTYAYDDWKTTVTDKNSKVRKYYKDAYDNLVKVDEVNSSSTYSTNYEWNLNNKLTKITDALSNIRNFTYDGVGRRLTAEDLHASGDATFGTWTYTYDDAGNLTQTLSPNALTTNYTYNDINQILTEDYTGAAGTEITYTYGGCTNGIEKLCSVVMTSGANTTYTYDSNGNIASEAKTINSNAYTTSYTYDRQGNKLTITYPDSAQVKYTFNTAGLLEKIERKENGGAFTDVVSNFDYSPTDQVTTQAYPNTITTTNTYDANNLYHLTRRLTQNTVPTKLQDLNYIYDNIGNITEITDASNASSSKVADYVYDDLYRLTSATITAVASGQSPYTQTFTYDAVGNILTGPAGTSTYSGTGYANPHAATAINGVTYNYDNNGNLTGNSTLANVWNYKDQLIKTVISGATSTYSYDHTGERVALKMGTTIIYPNDYYNTDNTKKTKSIYANDQLVATIETVGGVVTPYYIHVDNLNSTTAASNASGTSAELIDYYPFGSRRISSGVHSDKRQFVGQIYDTSTGLDYLNARYYKSDIGKFISQDPMFWQIPVQMLLDPQQQNSYSYARNNPINMKDPDGNWTVPGIINTVVKAITSLFIKKLTTIRPPTPPINKTVLPNATRKTVLNSDNFVSQLSDNKGCYTACTKMAGYTPTGSINVQTFNSSGGLSISPTASNAVKTIDNYLMNNTQVIVGVNRDGGSEEGNRNPASQHFVTINGYGYEENGTKYYHFKDPGTSNDIYGTSPNNKLYPDANGILTGHTAYNTKFTYTLTEVKTK